jgi:hypothetical protein
VGEKHARDETHRDDQSRFHEQAPVYSARSLATGENTVNGRADPRILLRLWHFAEGIFSQDSARLVRQ